MNRIAILYATREGHTRRIAEHISATLRTRGLNPEILSLRENDNQIVLYGYSGVILASSANLGKHEPEMIQFVRSYRKELEALPSAFLSVNLAEDAAERPGALLYSITTSCCASSCARSPAAPAAIPTPGASRDYQHADWPALDRFVEEFAAPIGSPIARSATR